MEQVLPSADLVQNGETAYTPGCLSVLLYPPISVLIFGGLLLFGLLQLKLAPSLNISQPVKSQLASFFSPSVLRWQDEIIAWAQDHGLDPNLVATVMQIESCGDPRALSRAGAMGLFQVMPYHFSGGEDAYSPHTNAARGLAYLELSLKSFDGNAGMALAGYNGGINGASRPQSQWFQETVDYKYWGENIYADAAAGKGHSPVLDEWLGAGGASLCAQAEQRVASNQ